MNATNRNTLALVGAAGISSAGLAASLANGVPPDFGGQIEHPTISAGEVAATTLLTGVAAGAGAIAGDSVQRSLEVTYKPWAKNRAVGIGAALLGGFGAAFALSDFSKD